MEKLLNESINQHSVADQPIGTYLSGGLDSSLITKKYHSLCSKSFKSYTANIKNYDKELLSQKVTDDFIIYEMGDKFTLNEFTDFIESAGFLGWESTEWFLSDFTISIDNNSAHASYLNVGVFIYPNPYAPEILLKENKQWLESIFIVREGEDLKIKFLQSDEIYSKVTVYRKLL